MERSDPTTTGIPASTPPGAARKRIEAMAALLGEERFRARAAQEFVARTRPEEAVPDVYPDVRSLVRDGIEFFLARISLERLLDLGAAQMGMAPGCSSRERLLELAKRFPTLHKLGQIVARNPHLDPAMKRWLVALESGRYGTPVDGLLSELRRHAEDAGTEIWVEPVLLSEASVAAVFGFRWTPPGKAGTRRGVFKVLKPDVGSHLEEELGILEELAAYFSARRDRYGLGAFRFVEVFREVRRTLAAEVDLRGEQSHLAEAARSFAGEAGVTVPRILPFCGETVTAMEFVKGVPISDRSLTRRQRTDCARRLYEAVVVKPLFSRRDPELFHGDPHAGNVLAVTGRDGSTGIALLDWSLSGRLTRRERVRIMALVRGVVTADGAAISEALLALSATVRNATPLPRDRLRGQVEDLIRSEAFKGFGIVKKAFWLLDRLARTGVLFPANLTLLRKAVFTVEGVVLDLDPDFDMDAFTTRHIGRLVASEMPLRLGGLVFPLTDAPERYHSLLSNGDLCLLAIHRYLEAVGQGTTAVVADLLEVQTRWLAGWLPPRAGGPDTAAPESRDGSPHPPW
jgi:ubiquinone biosynthesis protein